MRRSTYFNQLLVIVVCLALVFASACAEKRTWKRDPETGKYYYPVTPDMPEWAELVTHADQLAVCDIPDYVLEDVTETELVELVLQNPMLGDVLEFNSFQEGINFIGECIPPVKTILEDGSLRRYVEENTDENGNLVFTFDTSQYFEYGITEYIEQGLARYPYFASACAEKLTWKRDPETGKYYYPVTPDMPEWAELAGNVDQLAVCDIPDYVLEDVTETELVELVLQNPKLGDVTVFNSFQEGLNFIGECIPPVKTILEDGSLRRYVEENTDENGNLVFTFDTSKYFEYGITEYIEQGLALYP